MDSISIYVVSHKLFDTSILKDPYLPIYVGKITPPEGCTTDKTGDSIADKNSDYCELTALYWIWKNCSSDIVGLCHYRRLLCSRKKGLVSFHLLTSNEISRILSRYDVIVPMCYYFREAVVDEPHHVQYLKVRDIIKESCPDYLASFDWFFGQLRIYPQNMFIARKETVDAYCQWLFGIFNIYEKRYGLKGDRLYGFLSERLFNVWLCKNKLRLYPVPVNETERPKKKKTDLLVIKARIVKDSFKK
jgi:hypothetical protein